MPLLTPFRSDDPPSSDDPKWKIYEKTIADLKESFDDCEVIRNHKVTGKQSGVERQIDVWLRAIVGGTHEVTVAIECKCYDSTKIDIKDIDAFCGFLEDVGADKGVFITSSSFTDGARKRASGARIELQIMTLEEAEDFDWADYLEQSCHSVGQCWGTVHWQYEDGSSAAGYCDYCSQFHIKCGNCGYLSDYDLTSGSGSHSWETVKCEGCKQTWRFSFEKGEVDGFEELALSGGDDDEEEEDEHDENGAEGT